MSEASGELAQRHQLILLLIGGGHFAHPITHDPHKTLCENWHSLQQLGKQRDRKAHYPTRRCRPASYSELCHPGEREHPGHFARRISCSRNIHISVMCVVVAVSVHFSFKENCHPIRWVALPEQNVASGKSLVLDVFSKPLQLVVRQISKHMDTSKCFNSIGG